MGIRILKPGKILIFAVNIIQITDRGHAAAGIGYYKRHSNYISVPEGLYNKFTLFLTDPHIPNPNGAWPQGLRHLFIP